MTKILVGTLYSGENEYDECIAAIQKQTFKNFDHMLVEKLPELEAHNKLYKSFIDNADIYELLIKVDADTVLISEDLFQRIIDKFAENQWLEVMNIGVYDFFTDEMIAAGIQIYRNTVKWDFSKDTVFPDIPIFDKERYIYDRTELAPAATHCQNPSVPQSFHYGVHRGLKAIQKIHSTSHWAMLKKVWNNFLNKGDRRLGFAVLGAELVNAGVFHRKDQNYTNPKLEEELTKYQDYSAEQLKLEIYKLRFFHWGILPDTWRRKLLRWQRGKLEGRWDK